MKQLLTTLKYKGNNGFTLIEIIICIVLVVLIGGTSVIVVNKKNNNDVNKIEKRILEAAQVYVEVEKDSNGKDYLKEISNGRKGLKIPFKTLVNEGYIKEDEVDKVYKENKDKLDNKDFYVLLLAEGGDACSNSELQYTLSYTIDTSNPVYLCESVTPSGGGEDPGTGGESKNFIDELKNKGYLKLNKDITIDDFRIQATRPYIILSGGYSTYSYNNTRIFHSNPQTQGLYTVNEEDFYYRGNVSDNYVKLQFLNDNIDPMFRIVNFNNAELKLVSEENLSIEKTNAFCMFINSSNIEYTNKTQYIQKIYNDDIYNIKITDDIKIDEIENDDRCADLLTFDDLWYAGVLPYVYMYNGSDYQEKHSSITKSFWISESYLTDGANTELDFKIGEDNIVFISNQYDGCGSESINNDNMCGSYYWKGLLINKELTSFSSTRPVIVVKTSNVLFTGEGSKHNPYVLTFKQ